MMLDALSAARGPTVSLAIAHGLSKSLRCGQTGQAVPGSAPSLCLNRQAISCSSVTCTAAQIASRSFRSSFNTMRSRSTVPVNISGESPGRL